MARRLVALLVLLCVTPVAPELVEWAAHAITHGDFAHAEDGEHEETPAEHGCTALSHSCGMQGTVIGSAVTMVPAPTLPAPGATPLWALLTIDSRLADPPPHRPPIV